MSYTPAQLVAHEKRMAEAAQFVTAFEQWRDSWLADMIPIVKRLWKVMRPYYLRRKYCGFFEKVGKS